MRDVGTGDRRDAAPVAPEGSFLRYPWPRPGGWLCGRKTFCFPQGFVLGGTWQERPPRSLGLHAWQGGRGIREPPLPLELHPGASRYTSELSLHPTSFPWLHPERG